MTNHQVLPLSAEKLKLRTFWYGQAIAAWLIIPLLAPQIYYALFIPALAMPQSMINSLAELFPVFSMFQDKFDAIEAQRYQSAYVVALIIGIICLPLGVRNYAKHTYYEFLYSERVGGPLLEIGRERIKSHYKIRWFVFVVFTALLCPAFVLWICLYNQIAPLILVSIFSGAFQFFFGFFLSLYIKRSWLIKDKPPLLTDQPSM